MRIAPGVLLTLVLTVCAWGADAPQPIVAPKPTSTPKPTLAASDVVYAVDFDKTPVGPYGSYNLRKDWKNLADLFPEDALMDRLEIVEGKDAFKGRSLRLMCPKGTAGGPTAGGAGWIMNLGKGNREMFLSYWVRFAPGFEYAGGGKLPGFCGGEFPKPGKGASTTGWSQLIYWNAGRNHAICQYVYSLDQRDAYGDHFFWRADRPVAFQPNIWSHVETRVVMNRPGQRDGILQSWANGRLVLDKRDMNWRNKDTVGVDQFVFTVFFGGSGPEYESKKDEYIYFDNFVISRKYAGPKVVLPEPEPPSTTPAAK